MACKGRLIFCAVMLFSAMCTGVPLRSSGRRLMRFKDGKPVALRPSVRAPVPASSAYSSDQLRHDVSEMARRYIDELLTRAFKLQTDKTNMEKFVTEMLMWRKRTFPIPAQA